MTLPAKKRVRPFPLAELPRVARAQVEAARLLMARLPLDAGAEWQAACRALGGEVTLTVTEVYALPARELTMQARGAAVKLTLPGQRWALVVVESALAGKLARAALGIEEPELGAPRPLTLAEEGALEFLVAALAGETAQVAGVAGEGALASLAISVADGWLAAAQARVTSPAGDGWARLIVPDALRLGAPAPRTLEAILARAGRLDDAHVPLRLEVGRTAVARDDLSGLAAGDVILFERFGVRDARGGPVTLRLGRGGFAARLDGDALAIVQQYRLNLGAPNMDFDPSQKPDAASADQLLRELPVEVVCELGRVTISGRELIELRPGAVIPAGRPLSGPVDLTVGGRVVARGELVDVEGEIGVRIVQICE
ncbi:MAG: type secretion system apparatus protein YscQ/HrcQ [Myxococcales bacterium]|nr:type secretion system apparatus protein YscQ/HrcQ [Myxococcales bacterium]